MCYSCTGFHILITVVPLVKCANIFVLIYCGIRSSLLDKLITTWMFFDEYYTPKLILQITIINVFFWCLGDPVQGENPYRDFDPKKTNLSSTEKKSL